MKTISRLALTIVLFLACLSASAVPPVNQTWEYCNVMWFDAESGSAIFIAPFIFRNVPNTTVSITGDTVTIRKPPNTVTVTIGSREAKVNRSKKRMPCSPRKVDNRIYIPVLFIANELKIRTKVDKRLTGFDFPDIARGWAAYTHVPWNPNAPAVDPKGADQVFYPPTDEFKPVSTSQFGARWLGKCNCGKWKTHCGGDYDLYQVGTIVTSAADGYVKAVGNYGTGWGKFITVEYPYQGNVCCWTYGHIVPRADITVGMAVTQGRILGTIDPSLKWPSAPHLHVSVYLGPYDANISMRGALPACGNVARCGKQFPDMFVDPNKFLADHSELH